MELREVFKHRRHTKKYTHRDMGRLCDLSHRVYQKIELGYRPPKHDELLKIAKVLDIPIEDGTPTDEDDQENQV